MHSRLYLEDRKIFNRRFKRHCLFRLCLCIILSTGVKFLRGVGNEKWRCEVCIYTVGRNY